MGWRITLMIRYEMMMNLSFLLVITNPASKAAAESIYNRKLGNPTFNNKNISSFE